MESDLKNFEREQFQFVKVVDAPRSRVLKEVGFSSLESRRQAMLEKRHSLRQMDLWEQSAALYEHLELYNMEELAGKTREMLSSQLFHAWKHTVSTVERYFLEAQRVELQNTGVSEWRKTELKGCGSSLWKISRYFLKYYAGLQDYNFQQHLRMVSVLEKMAASITGSHTADYCKSRISQLAGELYLKNFIWNQGGQYRELNWNSRLPTDALLVLRLFCSHIFEISGLDIFEGHYLDYNDASAIFPQDDQHHGTADFFMDDSTGFQLPIKSVAFVEYALYPNPQFALLVDERTLSIARQAASMDEDSGSTGCPRVVINGSRWQLWQAQPGPENVFHVLALFLYLIQTKFDNQLQTFNPSRFGMNLE